MKELESLFAALIERLKKLKIADLPAVSIDGLYINGTLPVRTSAVYFLRSESPSAPFKGGENRARPGTKRNGILYIGKATDLRQRWNTQIITQPSGMKYEVQVHQKLKEAIALGDVRLHWWAVDKPCLAIAESLLIQLHRPPWNNHIY
jgi:hypothetical protein